MKVFIVMLLTIFYFGDVYSQMDIDYYFGEYKDWTTNLRLNSDSTFQLTTVDYVFPQTFKQYTNLGEWIITDEKEIILNPNLKRRFPIVKFSENKIDMEDSIQIKINYFHKVFENNELIKVDTVEFDLLTIYINKPKKYYNIVHDIKRNNCAFSHKIKHQLIVDSTYASEQLHLKD